MKNNYISNLNNVHKVIVIGAGCAGLSSAIYLARANLKPLLFAGSLEYKGGLLTKTSIVENYPGFSDGIMGFDLIKNMEDQALKYGTQVIDENVKQIKKLNHSANIFLVTDTNNKEYYTHTIVIATGSTPNKLGLADEDRFWANGISSCAVCDGALYRNKKIIVVGGGDSATEHALFLTKFSNVTLIHRRDTLRASSIMQDKVLNNDKIKLIFNTVITKLNGGDKLQSISCRNSITNDDFELEVDGLFYGLGLTPNSELFKDIIELDDEGYVIKYNADDTTTSVSGIFVAGDVSDKKYRQAIVACGEGCKAALDVNEYLVNNNI